MHQGERLEGQTHLEVHEEVSQFDFPETLLQILHAWLLFLLMAKVTIDTKMVSKAHIKDFFFGGATIYIDIYKYIAMSFSRRIRRKTNHAMISKRRDQKIPPEKSYFSPVHFFPDGV